MLTYKRTLLLSALAMLLTLKVGAQNSLGDPVLYEDFGFGGPYSPVGSPLPDANTGMKAGGDGRCPGPGRYFILNTSANCYGDTFATINFDHSGTSPFGYLMMINGDNAPVVYYTNVISGSKFCSGATYQFAVFIKNINTQMPRPAGYANPNIVFTVKSAGGLILANQATGAITNDGFVQYHIDFVAPADGSDVVISLSNASLTGVIGNDFALDDITVKPYGPQIDAGITSTTGAKAVTQCLDDKPAKYILRSFAHEYATPQYQWQLNYNSKGWKNLPGETNAELNLTTDFLAPAIGVYQYRVGALSGPGASLNCQTFSVPIVITVLKNPQFRLPPITYVCKGEALSLHADGGTSYLWTYPDGHTSTDHFLDVVPSVDESYQGDYTVTISNGGVCTTTSTTKVVVVPALDITVDSYDVTICQGQSKQIGVTGGQTYKWYADTDKPALGLDHDDVMKPIASPTVTTQYSVFVSNDGCTKQRTITVHVIPAPIVSAGNDVGMNEDEPINLKGRVEGDNVTYYWTPTDYMDDPTSLTPKIDPPDNITYTLHAVSAMNCSVITDQVDIKVFKRLRIPTSFSPNNDGVNDNWNIGKLNTYPESVLTIYTREGSQIFRTVGDARQWNGLYNGKAMPPGTYYYVIDLKNNLPAKTGWVVLLR